jgi:putative DNA methylase
MPLTPFSWKDRPALIESLLPVRKLSAESYKEQMAGAGKTLTALGSYWKGRKPLILNKACVLGCLLPATDDPLTDLKVFELLMGMDETSLDKRLRHKGSKEARELVLPSGGLNGTNRPGYAQIVDEASRPEECDQGELFAHVWDRVNGHLGTAAASFPELVMEMGIARFGRRPKVADVFCGSGQIPFEAARLGCDVYASDLNPIACMLTWGAFHIVGAPAEQRASLEAEQARLAAAVEAEIEALGVESDGKGWRAKAFLYCVEVVCPQSGWRVPLMPSLIISAPRTGPRNNVVAVLRPVPGEKRYDVEVRQWVPAEELPRYKKGTVQDGCLVHPPGGPDVLPVTIQDIRGDHREGKQNRNRLRLWEKSDIIPRFDDIFQERLYCTQWMRPKASTKQSEYEFRSVTPDDLRREQMVIDHVQQHLAEWQDQGFIPDMRIEEGEETDRLLRERGWTHWHHLFNPRQLLVAAMINQKSNAIGKFSLSTVLNWNSRLSIWGNLDGGGGSVKNVFMNQALNTTWNNGTRTMATCRRLICGDFQSHPLRQVKPTINTHPASEATEPADLFITDPPYGDAVKYEEITEFFIAWLRKNPPAEFAGWVWDSRRAVAIKGEDDDFLRGMIRAYRRMGELMPENGMQVLMFTHQSGSIWADLANIIWASGLRVTAAWYVVTETDSALRDGAHVTGTILLVLRKRLGEAVGFRDDLGWEIQEAVKEQIEGLTGLDQRVKEAGAEGLYADADLQMAGYAAALKVLTSYSHIDGKDMVVEAEAPRVEGRKSFVEALIDFAVQTAVQFLVPLGFERGEWQRLGAVERFYLKMAELEHLGEKSLDNYLNFAKAFNVKDFGAVMSEVSKANHARLKLSVELKGSQMTGEGELPGTRLRAVLYALHEMANGVEIEDVLIHLEQIYGDFRRDRTLLAKMADYLGEKRGNLKAGKGFSPDVEASNARILGEAIRNQRI